MNTNNLLKLYNINGLIDAEIMFNFGHIVNRVNPKVLLECVRLFMSSVLEWRGKSWYEVISHCGEVWINNGTYVRNIPFGKTV